MSDDGCFREKEKVGIIIFSSANGVFLGCYRRRYLEKEEIHPGGFILIISRKDSVIWLTGLGPQKYQVMQGPGNISLPFFVSEVN